MNQFLTFTVVLSALYFLPARGSSDQTENDALKATYNLIHSTKGEPIAPSLTLELLKSLNKHYTDDTGAQGDKSRIQTLISVSQLDIGKCDYQSMMIKNSLLNNYRRSTVALVPYLNYFITEQNKICKQLLASKLRKEIDSLNMETRRDIELLRHAVVNIDEEKVLLKPFVLVPPFLIEKGVLTFMEQKLGDAFKRDEYEKAGFDKFNQDFSRLIENLCHLITPASIPTANLYELYFYAQELVSKTGREFADPTASIWLTNLHLCQRIRNEPTDVARGAYKLLTVKKLRMYA